MNSLISIVVPVYNEEDNVLFFYDAIKEVLAIHCQNYKYEIIYVDDGSKDDSVKRIATLKTYKCVEPKLIRLSRNFGKEAAVTAGLASAKGEAVIIIDVDLQHPVEKIPEFIKSWEGGADIVIGVRDSYSSRGKIKIALSKLFYKMLSVMSATDIVPHSTDYRLLSREVVGQYNLLTEHNRIVRGLIDWLGYDRQYIEFAENQRERGTPSYSYSKLIKLAMTTFIQHSFFPLRVAGYLGGLITLFAGVLGVFFLIEDIILKDPMGLQVSGTAMLGTLTLFLVGVILTSMGLMGLYVASIHDETANRPNYIIRKNNKV